METMTLQSAVPAGPGATQTDERRAEPRQLRVSDIMSTEVVTVTENETVFSAAAKMSEYGVSCVIVGGNPGIAGILTEKDVLKGVAQPDTDFRRLLVCQRMSHPAHVVPADASLLDAGAVMEAQGIKRLPVVRDGQLIGIVTQTDITRGLISMSALRYVQDIMTRQLATVDPETTADEAARLMSARGISCLVVRHRQRVGGILTEKDLLRRVVALHRNPSQTRAAEIMSFPIICVSPGHSILSASRKMEAMHLHRLVVMDEKEICGIITQTDILRAIHHAFATLESQRSALVAQMSGLLRSVVQDAEKLQGFLHAFQNPPGAAVVRGSADAGPAGGQVPLPASGPYLL
jgi:CBS domain-containing protein